MKRRLLLLSVLFATEAIGGCTPPPAVWPVGGASPLPVRGVSVAGYAGGGIGEDGGSPTGDFGGDLQYRMAPELSLGASAGWFAGMNSSVLHARGYARLHLADDHLSPILGVGAGSIFGQDAYGTVDLGLAAGLRSAGWELYGVPTVGLGLMFHEPTNRDTLYVGALAGVVVEATSRTSLGIEALGALTKVFNRQLDTVWGGGAGAFVRYLLDDGTKTPPSR